ncbi:MAG: DUF222 domain-containing protein [Nocardioides sp.]|nr:DUF222 domain-containing protein [Nocardioides sp.]
MTWLSEGVFIVTDALVSHWPGEAARSAWDVALDEIESALSDLVGLNPAFLDTAGKRRVLARLQRLQAQQAALEARILAVADDVAAEAGDRDVAAWMRRELHVDGAVARARLRLANDLDARWAGVAEAYAAGHLSEHQARVIVRALDDLHDDSVANGGVVTDEQIAMAEEFLVAEAAELPPRELRLAGRHILAVIDPDLFDRLEAKRLEREEEAAAKRIALTMRDTGTGSMEIRANVPLAVGARLRTYLEAFAQPRKQQLAKKGRRQPWERLMGQAFVRLVESVDPDDLPHHGGDSTTVMITMTLDQLRSELGTASFGFEGDTITAGEARRMACNAQIVPVVLGGRSEVLDAGRASRLATPIQRKLLRMRYQTCCAEGCDIPATWTDVHHLDPWSLGGKSDMTNLVLLCAHHHGLAHKAGYAHERLADGAVRFHRRP